MHVQASRDDGLFRILSRSWQGDLLRAGDSNFALASRVWNAAAQTQPRLIARCASAEDVQRAVRAAKETGALAAVRCGGHSLAGFGSCDGGLVIDLCGLRQVAVDAAMRQARFGGGCRLAEVDGATQAAGLAFPAGVVSHTGAGGLVLGGGTGWLTRLLGMSCDHVLGFTIVLASGELIRADESQHADLYWALRGGGGNFGVVTEFSVRLHPLTELELATSYCFGDDMFRALEAWADFMPEAPEALKWNLSLRLAPRSPDIPARLQGRPALSVAAAWFGDADEGRRVIGHIFGIGHHEAASSRTMRYLALQTMADDDFPHGRRYYTKTGYFRRLGAAPIRNMVAALETVPSASTQIELSYLGGAAGRVAAAETAFGDRSAPFIVNILADWLDPAEDVAQAAWVRDLYSRLRPSMAPGAYVNFMSGDENERVPEVYRGRWERLVAVKTKYDPGNFFRRNQNIAPQEPDASNRAPRD